MNIPAAGRLLKLPHPPLEVRIGPRQLALLHQANLVIGRALELILRSPCSAPGD